MCKEKIYIGIGGAKTAGKDTSGLFFEELGFTKVNFGDNLKRMCSYVFDIPLQYFYDTIVKELPFKGGPVVINLTHLSKMTEWVGRTHNFRIPVTPFLGYRLVSPREMMQYVGTDIIRAVHPGWHVEATMSRMAECDKMVCCDIRFPNEIHCIKQLALVNNANFISIYLTRPGCNAVGHASETSVRPDMCQYVLDNNGDIGNLHRMLKVMLEDRLRMPEVEKSAAA